MSWAGIAGILCSAFMLNDNTPYPGSAAAFPVLAAAVAIAGGTVQPRHGAEVILGSAPFQWLGKLSYSVYLWHWPLLTIAAQCNMTPLSTRDKATWVSLSVILAFVTYNMVENPLRRARILKAHQVYSVIFGLLLVATSCSVCSWGCM